MTDLCTDTERERDSTVATDSPAPAPWQAALDIAAGRAEPAPDEPGHKTWGARNQYNSRGRGSTEARRVLRDGSWTWVSRPASRDHYRAAGRYDVQHGNVWRGEIVATYTLGGSREPTQWILVDPHERDGKKYIGWTLVGRRRRDGRWNLWREHNRWDLRREDNELTVPDPYWR